MSPPLYSPFPAVGSTEMGNTDELPTRRIPALSEGLVMVMSEFAKVLAAGLVFFLGLCAFWVLLVAFAPAGM
jgi:hypothetical protein